MDTQYEQRFQPPYCSVHELESYAVIIYDKRLKPSLETRLTSAVDIKSIILFLLGIRNKEENTDKFIHSGKNVFLHENDFIFASNLYANQSVSEEIKSNQMAKLNNFSNVEYKNKTFGVMDGKYYLIVGNDGMELFNMKPDPLNYNNLLNFFEIDESGAPVKFNNHGAWRGHFRLEIMDDRQIFDCLSHYFVLRQRLMEHINTKNKLVKDKKPSELNLFDFSCFNKIRPRNFIF